MRIPQWLDLGDPYMRISKDLLIESEQGCPKDPGRGHNDLICRIAVKLSGQ